MKYTHGTYSSNNTIILNTYYLFITHAEFKTSLEGIYVQGLYLFTMSYIHVYTIETMMYPKILSDAPTGVFKIADNDGVFLDIMNQSKQ